MLVLTRKVGEIIVLPQLDIEVTVLEVRRGRVRVGIKAPAEIEIQRQELLDRPRKDQYRPALASSTLGRDREADENFVAAAVGNGAY